MNEDEANYKITIQKDRADVSTSSSTYYDVEGKTKEDVMDLLDYAIKSNVDSRTDGNPLSGCGKE